MIESAKPRRAGRPAALALIGLAALAPAAAWSASAPVEGAGYNVAASLADNLKAFTGEKVSLTLDAGVVLTGVVKQVGDHLVHLERLEGKDYFDALVRLESIQALDARFREPQR